MTKTNDEKILGLKKLIDEKKEKLGKIGRFSPITNCSLELDGQRININVLNRDQLTLVASKLQSYLMASKTLGLSEKFVISGYAVSDWIEDIVSKIGFLSKADEARELTLLESKLEKMLSDEKKTELELDEIASLLNG